jgi:hypothetical protein
MLRNVVIHADRNVIKKEAKKILKYKDFIIEIQRMWNVKVIILATGTISKSHRQYQNNIKRKHEMEDIQKNSHIVHCTHTAESMYKHKTYFTGEITLHVA